MSRPHRTRALEIDASVRSSAPAERVMDRIATPSTWPRWQSEILSTEGPRRVGEGDVVEGRARLLGFDVRGRSAAVDVTDEVFFEDVIVGVRMRIRYTVIPDGAGSVIAHHMEADLPAGPLGRVLSVFLARRLRRMQGDLLRRLRDQAESELDPS